MGVLKTGNYLYLSVSKGLLVNKKKQIETRGYEGLLIGIDEKADEWEGKPLTKVQVKMKDTKTGETAIIEFNQESWYSIGFFSRIEKIDLHKPFTMGVSPSDKNEKISFCWLGQKGLKNAKTGKETAEPRLDFPHPEERQLGRNKVQDWTKPLQVIIAIIDRLKAELGPEPELESHQVPDDAGSKVKSPFEEQDGANDNVLAAQDDDLPF